MKRSGFNRPVLARVRTVHKPIPLAQRRNASITQCVGTADPIEKENALQHAAYMDLVRAMPCAHCGRAPRSQFCHTDETKGMGIKTDCRKGWPGCDACHYAIGTQRIYPRDERRALEARYAAQTRAAIQAAGLWPATLPLWSEYENR
jgi:hypothetical protein